MNRGTILMDIVLPRVTKNNSSNTLEGVAVTLPSRPQQLWAEGDISATHKTKTEMPLLITKRTTMQKAWCLQSLQCNNPYKHRVTCFWHDCQSNDFAQQGSSGSNAICRNPHGSVLIQWTLTGHQQVPTAHLHGHCIFRGMRQLEFATLQ